MEDKIDELFAILGNNKKSLIIAIIVYVVITLAILVVIWWPEEKDYATYEAVNIETKKATLGQNYLNTLSEMFKNSRTSELESLISSKYINYTEKSADDIISELTKEGYFSNKAEVRGISIYEDGDTYVYSTTVYSGNNKRTINIIEKYPYNYEIVFDDFYTYEVSGNTYTNKNIKFTIESIYRNLKYVEINMKIENLNDTYARFDFTSTVGVQAVLEDGTKYSPSNLISGEAYTNIESNMMVNKSFVFEIPAQLQEGIKYIVFNGVNLEFSKSNIQVNI